MDATKLIVTVLELIGEPVERGVQLCRVHIGNVVSEPVEVGDGHLFEPLPESEDFEDVVLAEAGDSYSGPRTTDDKPGAFKNSQSFAHRRPGDTKSAAEMFLHYAIVRSDFPAKYQFADLDCGELRQTWTVDERVRRL